MKSIFGSVTLAALSILTLALAQDLSKVTLRGVTYGGTGCPQGSEIAYYSNNSRIVIAFDSLTGYIGPLFPVTENRDNCQINLDIAYPKGIQYTLGTAAFVGTVDLNKGITATLKTTAYFSGSAAQTSAKADFVGPLHEQWSLKQWDYDALSTYTVWSDCNNPLPLNVNTQVLLASSDSTKSGTISTDGRYDFTLFWRKC